MFQAATRILTAALRGAVRDGFCVDWLHSNRCILYPLFPMSKDTTPATKADLLAHRTELQTEMQGLRREMVSFTEEIKRDFDVVAENLRHDMLGAIGDIHPMVKNHEWRLQRLNATPVSPRNKEVIRGAWPLTSSPLGGQKEPG